MKKKYVPVEPWVVERAVPLGSRQAINAGEKERGRYAGQTGAQREEDDEAKGAAMWERGNASPCVASTCN